MTIFHTSILNISTYFVFLYFHLFTVPTMPRARALVIRRRFYKLPSVSRIFHTFVWLFVPPAFCLRRLFRVPTTWILLASLAKLSSNYGICTITHVNAAHDVCTITLRCEYMQMHHLVVDGYALVTIAKLSDYGFHLIRKVFHYI